MSIVINTLIDVNKMKDIQYLKDRVVISYSICNVSHEKKDFILEFMLQNILTFIKHAHVKQTDEFFINLNIPGFDLRFNTRFV